MKFEAVNVKDYVGFKETKLQRFLSDFNKAQIPVAEVIIEHGEYSSLNSAYVALNCAIMRLHLNNNITARVKQKRLYLINNVLYESASKE